MSASRHLQTKQFGTAYEQGKPVSDWLATNEGHYWQNDYRAGRLPTYEGEQGDSEWLRGPSGFNGQHPDVEAMNGFFSIKKQHNEDDNQWEFGSAASTWPEPEYHNDIERNSHW